MLSSLHECAKLMLTLVLNFLVYPQNHTARHYRRQRPTNVYRTFADHSVSYTHRLAVPATHTT